MKRHIVVLVAAAFAVFGIVGTANASTAPGSFKDGPYTATTPDSGCQGNNWAQDLFVRNFVVTLPAVGGVYTVKEKFQRGHFSTFDGASPGNGCGGQIHIKEGVNGTFSGRFVMSVSGGTFDPNGACVKHQYEGWMQCDTAGWVEGFFGPSATYSVDQYSFTYNASGQGLIAGHWVNADTGNSGDIASS
jgi:hypothetical protein